MNKIYVVIRIVTEFEDSNCEFLKAFKSLNKAKKFVKKFENTITKEYCETYSIKEIDLDDED